MKNIQVRNVADATHAVLRKRAAEAGMSLQEYLLGALHRLAMQPTLGEVLSRVENRTGGRLSLNEAARRVRSDRNAG